MDEIFGEENFVNEIVWGYRSGGISKSENMPRKHDNILLYKKSDSFKVNNKLERQYLEKSFMDSKQDDEGRFYVDTVLRDILEGVHLIVKDNQIREYNTRPVLNLSSERSDYPTQKPEGLLEIFVEVGSNPGDLVLDCFCGSGTTLAVAQKLGRRWIGCDINLGAIQTTTKRLNQILEEQKQKKLVDKFEGLNAFKIYNVNDYEVFKNEIEAEEIVMDIYGVEPIKRSYFDGVLDQSLVKIMPLNRVLNKMDIENLFAEINKSIDQFTPKVTTSKEEETYEEEVLVIASGVELDAKDYLRKENKTGVKVEVRDIQADKKNLLFKKPAEADIDVKVEDKKVLVSISEFYSPLLVQKLELENEKQLNPKGKVVIEDFKQVIDSVCIDINYDGKLFNAEIMDLPDKKSLISGTYEHEYKSKGKYTLAIKIVDVLGEEYFETFEISIK